MKKATTYCLLKKEVSIKNISFIDDFILGRTNVYSVIDDKRFKNLDIFRLEDYTIVLYDITIGHYPDSIRKYYFIFKKLFHSVQIFYLTENACRFSYIFPRSKKNGS